MLEVEMKRAIFGVILVSIFMVSCATAYDNRNHNETSIDDAVKIARNAIENLGYDNDKMKMGIFINHIPWFFNYPNTKSYESGYTKKLKEKLNGKTYWAIYFLPKGHTWEDGDVCVFIDMSTDGILTVYEGSKLVAR